MRYDNNIVCSIIRWLIHVQQNLKLTTPYYYSVYGGENEAVETKTTEEGSCTWVQVQSESDRVLNLTSVQFIVHGHLKKRVMKQLL